MNDDPPERRNCFALGFMIWESSQVIFIGFLNFTKVIHSRKKYSFKVLAPLQVKHIRYIFICLDKVCC